MSRVKLIVTGDLEKFALHKSLQRIFPEVRNGKVVSWETPRKLNCATSHRLRPLEDINGNISAPMKKLAWAMYDEVFAVKNKKKYINPADLVIVIDDIELHNLGQEDIIVDHFRKAIELVLEKRKDNQENYRIELRKKCSFHLLKPMIESYFFGDIKALQKAGVPVSEKPRLVHPTDVELLETNDPHIDWIKRCANDNAEKKLINNDWWRCEQHPKRYLEHLIKRNHPAVPYDETDQGRKALETLAWNTVPKVQTDAPFIRSLFEDISEWYGISNPIGIGKTNDIVYPDKSIKRETLLLRNV
ncbi:hypothetical protein MHK_006742 [Candidatus Magnetomorum sp. HK-1]|nr:hypothetical protein MHK_006742 [Candidatus Magnetomorum sp. HK-1]